MNPIDQIEEDIKKALKDSSQEDLHTLRLVKNSFQNEQIKLKHKLNKEEAIQVLKREAKQREQSIQAYQQAGRDDLLNNEKKELILIQKYLPPTLNEKQLTSLVMDVISDLGIKDQTKMGQIIAEVIKRAKGQADGSVVAKIVREKIN